MSRPSPTTSPERRARASESNTQADRTIDVVLVDANYLVLDGLATLLRRESDLEVVATVRTVDDAAACVANSAPDVVVLDPDLGGEDGLRLVDRLEETDHPPRTMILTAMDHPDVLQHALGLGVTSYVLKQKRYEEVAAAIRQTARGEAVISPQLERQLGSTSASSEHTPPASLTVREQEVLEQFGVSRKPGMHSRASLVAEAFRRGLLR